jgi:oligoribonuclease
MNIETGTYSRDRPSHLVWIDLEMTGLDTDVHRIVEVAVIITDFTFKELARFEAVIHQSEEILAASNGFSLKAHDDNGLYAKVRTSKVGEHEAEQAVCALVRDHVPPGSVILAGNSIRADRLFIDSHWHELSSMLHYRMLDVSTLKVLWLGLGHDEYKKGDTHRALGDIEESIAELKFYLENL